MTKETMNRKAINILEGWDPFNCGELAYEQVIVETIEALHQFNHPVDLAKEIREIYEHSFTLWIPIEDCVQISYRLLAMKYELLSIV